ncbi:MAG: glycoside hydrolase family 28 protein [Bacteroidales bacterium]|nr:glycoside hydrolase family 28 protein [Bacteroidales bacterium]
MRKIIILSFLMISSIVFSKTIDVTDLGAINNGVFSNTKIINEGIRNLAKEGGGTLYFPSGVYLTGPIVLKSNITIHVEAGATIKFSDDFAEYTPFVEMRYEGVVMKSFMPLFYAYEQENITIKGEGLIDGNGKKWWYGTFVLEGAHKEDLLEKEVRKYQKMWDKENPNFFIEESSDWKRTLNKKYFRPPLFQTYKCKGVTVSDLTFINSPFWTINPEFCENVRIQGVTINNPDAPNTDGVNPSSCKNVIISNCNINVGDDCITLKSGRDLQGREFGIPCENITITNCIMMAGHGGVVIGSEMSGDVRRVTISNCIFDGTDRGIRLKSARGRGGIVEELRINNIVMNNIKKEAITLNLFYSDIKEEEFSERTPIFRNIHVSNLTGTNVSTACSILGIEESFIQNLSFSNINLAAQTGFIIDKAKDVLLKDIKISVSEGTPFVLSNSKKIHINNISSPSYSVSNPLIKVFDVENMFIQSCFPFNECKAFLELDGSLTNNIILKGNFLGNLQRPLLKGNNLRSDLLLVED